jgi:hypothetical protein
MSNGVVAVYIESLVEGRKFMRVAVSVCRKKPWWVINPEELAPATSNLCIRSLQVPTLLCCGAQKLRRDSC